MTWTSWLTDGRIEAHAPVREEIEAHRQAAERSLADAALPGLSPEGRFQLAYTAALDLATLTVHAADQANELLSECRLFAALIDGWLAKHS
jgi:hypothetical protein